MMLNIRTRIFLIVSVVVLFILAGAILIWVFTKDKNPAEEGPVNNSGNQIEEGNFDSSILSTQPTVVPAGTKVKTVTTEEMEKNAAVQIAKVFTERYGTYSTHGEYENIKEVLDISTDSFAAVLSEKIPDNLEDLTPGVYQGVTIEAIATELADWQGDAAKVEVNVIKRETKDGQTTNSNTKATVNLKKVGEDWLVDSFSWD